MENNNVLIAGGSGLIGLELISLFKEKGYGIHVLSRSEKKLEGTVVFKWDIEKRYIDPEALRGVHTIINLAGSGVAEKAWTVERKADLLNSRVQSTRLLFDALSSYAQTITTYISPSGIGIYPEGDDWLTEETPPATNFLAGICKHWENEANTFKEKRIRTCIFRLGMVLSPKGGMLKELLKPFKLGVAPVFGNGKQWQSWVHIDDVCNMFLFTMENKNISGVYNVAAPRPVSNTEMIGTIQLSKKSSGFKVHVPLFVLKIALGERAEIVASNQKVSSEKIRDAGFKFKYSDIYSAISNLINKKKTL